MPNNDKDKSQKWYAELVDRILRGPLYSPPNIEEKIRQSTLHKKLIEKSKKNKLLKFMLFPTGEKKWTTDEVMEEIGKRLRKKILREKSIFREFFKNKDIMHKKEQPKKDEKKYEKESNFDLA